MIDRKAMYIQDPVYGAFDVNDPVLLALLEDPTVKRVAGVMQGGTTPQLWGWPDFSRLEHCVGAMLLVRKLGGSLEEQVAALLHDVPHTAFSHVIDHVFARSGVENYHEEVKQQILSNSRIPEILSKFGLDFEYIVDESNFGILERPLPMLCADRVDYALRSLLYYFNDLQTAKLLADHLIVVEGQIAFDREEYAVMFSQHFLRLIKDVIMGVENQAAYHLLAEVVRYALKQGILVESQLFLTDFEVLTILKETQDEFVEKRLNLMKPGIVVVEDTERYDYAMKSKMRWVNAPFKNDSGKLDYAFNHDERLVEMVEKYKARVKEPFYVRVVGLE